LVPQRLAPNLEEDASLPYAIATGIRLKHTMSRKITGTTTIRIVLTSSANNPVPATGGSP
jgi:hypothetical protein